MALGISDYLKGNIGKVLAGMISRKEEKAPISGFPLIKISFSRPATGIVAVMSGSDFSGIKGLEKDQKIYIYQED